MSTNTVCHQVDQHSDEVLSTLTFAPIKYDATVISCPVLSCPILSCSVLSRSFLSCPVLFSPFCLVVSYILSLTLKSFLHHHMSAPWLPSMLFWYRVLYLLLFFINFYDFTFISYLNMCGNLQFSRAARLSLKIGGEELALVPYADLMNHNPYR